MLWVSGSFERGEWPTEGDFELIRYALGFETDWELRVFCFFSRDVFLSRSLSPNELPDESLWG